MVYVGHFIPRKATHPLLIITSSWPPIVRLMLEHSPMQCERLSPSLAVANRDASRHSRFKERNANIVDANPDSSCVPVYSGFVYRCSETCYRYTSLV